jgi:DNA-binding IscR family transcriptional regulator
MEDEMRTSCRFAMAVHVLAVLAYKDGDRVTSELLAHSVNTNPVVIRRLLLTLQHPVWSKPAKARDLAPA